jgi:glycosyltransferase involved in cell wall biosynthesis
MSILNVAFSNTPVHPEALEGPEAIVSGLDRAIVNAGHRSIVIACKGSRVKGELMSIPMQEGTLDANARRAAQIRHRDMIRWVLRSEKIDLIHFHGVDVAKSLPTENVPVLVTLHAACDSYLPDALACTRPQTFFACVSQTQRAECARYLKVRATVPYGVDVHELRPLAPRERYAVVLGDITAEKGFHLAITAAKRAGIPLVIAGSVRPHPDHQAYFTEEIRPRLAEDCRFVGPVAGDVKRRLLAQAQCVLLPSLVAEPSSLVAMQALACGTPVVAFANPALSEIIDNGKTGFVVHCLEEMVGAIGHTAALDSRDCRHAATERMTLESMTAAYLRLYEMLRRSTTGTRLRPVGVESRA